MSTRLLTLTLSVLVATVAGCGGLSAAGSRAATLSFSQVGAPAASRTKSSPVPALPATQSAPADSGLPATVAPTAAPTAAGGASLVLAPAVSGLPGAAGTLTTLVGPFKPAQGERLESPIVLGVPPLAGGNWVEITLKRGADGTGSLAFQARYPAGSVIPPVVLAPGEYAYRVVSSQDHTPVAQSALVSFTVTAAAGLPGL